MRGDVWSEDAGNGGAAYYVGDSFRGRVGYVQGVVCYEMTPNLFANLLRKAEYREGDGVVGS